VQEPELLETLYVTQQLHQEAADLALESALRHLVSHSSNAAAARPEEAEVTKAISGLQATAQKFTHVSQADGVYGLGVCVHVWRAGLLLLLLLVGSD
jgi:hypothetical protein